MFKYYPPVSSIYRKVTLSGVSKQRGEDSKVCGKKIEIGVEINVADLCREQIEFVKKNCTYSNNADVRGAATAGEYSAATARGKASVGENGTALVRGNDTLVRGGMGAIIVAVEEEDESYEIKSWCAGVVDGKSLFPDVWYGCVNGVFVKKQEET